MKKVFLKKALVVSIGLASLGVMGAMKKQSNRLINPNNGHQYFLTEELSWNEAQALATKLGGYLVTINDAEENKWLVNTFLDEKVNFLWIGLNDSEVEGDFKWSNGEIVSYTNWANGEPNDNPANKGEDFGAINGAANPFNRPIGTWSDAPSFAKLRGIVEIEHNNSQ